MKAEAEKIARDIAKEYLLRVDQVGLLTEDVIHRLQVPMKLVQAALTVFKILADPEEVQARATEIARANPLGFLLTGDIDGSTDIDTDNEDRQLELVASLYLGQVEDLGLLATDLIDRYEVPLSLVIAASNCSERETSNLQEKATRVVMKKAARKLYLDQRPQA